MKRKIYLLPITAVLVSTMIVVLTPTQIHADSILEKAEFTELYECYINDSQVNPTISDVKDKRQEIDKVYKRKVGKVVLPNNYHHTVKNNTMNCFDLEAGDQDKFTGIISKKWTLTQQEMINFLPTVGYESQDSSGLCAAFVYKVRKKHTAGWGADEWSEPQDISSDQYCVENLDSSENITSNSKITVNSELFNTAGPNFFAKDKGRSLEVNDGKNGKKIKLVDGNSFESHVGEVYKAIANGEKAQYTEREDDMSGSNGTIYTEYTLFAYNPDNNITKGAEKIDNASVNGPWNISDMAKAYSTTLKNYSNFPDYSHLQFTQEEKSTLYKHYLKNWYGATVICEGDSEYDGILSTDVYAANVSSKKCYVRATKHNEGKDEDKVHGLTADLWWHQDLTLEQLVAEMSEDDILEVNAFSDTTDGDNTSADAERDPDCHTKGGALGWIVCPIIEQATNMIEQVYDDWIQPYLSIDAVLFDTSETGGQSIHQIWSIFQGFANLAFVLLFLVVIFSQLTGVGIDNYGIKKILPKLIIGAVLINMSYIICQLAVDISNIVGRAIASMFQQIADNVGINSGLNGISVNLYPDQVQDAVENQFTTVGNDNGNGTIVLLIVPIVAILGLGIFLAAGPAIIIPVLLAVISVVIGIFFLFALLALRQAVAVILVVVSPMAFATYMLPNTKKLFDKWYEAFKGMLIAYPIASALVFGGDLVSKILLVASGSTLITSLGLLLSAAVVAIAPIFFIPSVIRKSMGALSGIANVLQSGQKRATKRLGEGTSNRIQKSGLQRSFNQFKQVHLGAGVNGKGELNAIGKMKNKLTLTARGRADLAEARQKALGYISADKTNRRMLSSAGIAAAGAGIAAKAAQQDINDEITNMTQKTRNYNVDVMEQELVNLMSKENLKDEEKVYAKALMTKLSQSGGDGNKRLINIISGKTKANGNKTASKVGRELFADYATSTDIASSMGGKDAYIMQYLRDVRSGAGGTTNETTFDKWLTSENADRQIDGNIVTNAEFIAKTVLDDDEMLMKQSSDSLNRTVSIDAGKIIGSDGKTAVTPNGPLENTIGGQGAKSLDARRAVRILSNDNINKKEEQIQKLKKAIRISRLNSNINNHN